MNAVTILDFCSSVFTSIYCVTNFTYVLEFFWSIHRRILDNLSSLVHRRRLCSTWNRGSFQLQPRSPKLVLSYSYSMLFDRAERNWENELGNCHIQLFFVWSHHDNRVTFQLQQKSPSHTVHPILLDRAN